METLKGIAVILCLVGLLIVIPGVLILDNIRYKRERKRLIEKIKQTKKTYKLQ